MLGSAPGMLSQSRPSTESSVAAEGPSAASWRPMASRLCRRASASAASSVATRRAAAFDSRSATTAATAALLAAVSAMKTTT